MTQPKPADSFGKRSRILVLCLALLALRSLCPAALKAQEDPGDVAGDRLPGGQLLRGSVTAVSASALTVKSDTGEQFQVVVTDNTRVMKARQTAKFSAIKVGDGVGAGGVMDAPAKTLHAAFIAVFDAEEVRRAQAELGKSYIVGRVLSINELKLTIQRPDAVKQVIAVDEGTSFRRGGRLGNGPGGRDGAASSASAQRPAGPTGESITLADIKAGDSIAARGALKDGVFIPTELHVFDPGSRRAGQGSGQARDQVVHP